MPIQGTERMGGWGKKVPVNENTHVTQTNSQSRDGRAVHITTNIPGERAKVQVRCDENGNYLGSNFAKR